MTAIAAGVRPASASPPNSLDAQASGPFIYETLCLSCHGREGQGNPALQSPSIAGQPAWYVRQQLVNFQQGRRGSHPQDLTGALMAGMARLLQPGQVESVATTIERMAPVAPADSAALKAPSIEDGRVLFTERCMECHRYNASGELTFGSPPLTGLPDWYLLAQIDKYKKGWRGTHPQDLNGAKMVVAASFIETDQARHDVVAFILTLNAASGKPVKNGSTSESLFGSH